MLNEQNERVEIVKPVRGFNCIDTLIADQPDELSQLANVLRVDIILCRAILNNYNCRSKVDGVNFLKQMEQITLFYQQALPEMASTLSNRKVKLKQERVSLLTALSLYHSLALSPFFEGEAQMPYLNYYCKDLRPLLYKYVQGKLDEQIGMEIPESSLELPEEEIV